MRQCGEKVFAGGSRGKQIAADSMQQLTAESEFFLPETIGEKAKVADALKARRQGVEEKAAEELVGGDSV